MERMDGAALRGLRSELGLTQAGLAGVLGVHPVYLARMETGLAPISRPTRYAIALLRIRRMLEGNERPLAVSIREVIEEVVDGGGHGRGDGCVSEGGD